MKSLSKKIAAWDCFLFLITVSSYGGDWTGGWQGTLSAGMASFRVALVLTRDNRGNIQGTFNNIDDGIYDEPLRHLSLPSGRLQADLPTGEILDLGLDPAGDSLKGTYRQAQGSFQHPGEMSPLELHRGIDFLVPRLRSPGEPARYVYQKPRDLSDGWGTADGKDGGMDISRVQPGLQKVLEGTFPHIHGLVVVHRGKLVVDEYFYGYGPEDLHPIQSATKSVFSILMGIAQDRGLLQLDERLYDLFPECRLRPGWREDKNKVTVETLLTMTSGFACDDGTAPGNCSWAMVNSPDWLDFALEEPLEREPGRHFAYCGACLLPLSAALQRLSGLSTEDFSRQFLFDPLGIRDFRWMRGPQGLTPVSFGLELRPRDLAKLGLLILNKGKWEGRRIVSESWVAQSTAPQAEGVRTRPREDYGFLWWERDMPYRGKKVRIIFAWGVGGQYLFVVPELDLVCVVTGGNYQNRSWGANSLKLFEDYVLPAVKN